MWPGLLTVEAGALSVVIVVVVVLNVMDVNVDAAAGAC